MGINTGATKSIWKEIVDKTSLANIAAFILVVGGFIYAYNQKDGDLMRNAFLLGVGYLLGKAAAS